MSTKSQKPATAILCNDKDLSAAVDKILDLAKERTLSKSGLLNVLTASLFGPGKDWGFIKNSDHPLLSQRISRDAKDVLAQITAGTSQSGTAAATDELEEDHFTEVCISHAHEAFALVAQGDADIADAVGDIITDDELDAACEQAAREFIAQRYGNPIPEWMKGEILDEGVIPMITNPIFDEEWVILLSILDLDKRREEQDEDSPAKTKPAKKTSPPNWWPQPAKKKTGSFASFSRGVDAKHDDFTKKCIQHAASCFDHGRESYEPILNALQSGILTDEELDLACLKAATEIVTKNYGNPMKDFEDHDVFDTLNTLVGEEGYDRLFDILNLEARERRCAEPKAPTDLGAAGRNPAGLLTARTKTLGYQVWHTKTHHFWGSRQPHHVLSAKVAEADMAEAKAAGCGDDYAIIRIIEGQIDNPEFID